MWERGSVGVQKEVRGRAQCRFKDLASTYVLRPRLKNLVSFNLDVKRGFRSEVVLE